MTNDNVSIPTPVILELHDFCDLTNPKRPRKIQMRVNVLTGQRQFFGFATIPFGIPQPNGQMAQSEAAVDFEIPVVGTGATTELPIVEAFKMFDAVFEANLPKMRQKIGEEIRMMQQRAKPGIVVPRGPLPKEIIRGPMVDPGNNPVRARLTCPITHPGA